MNIDSSNANYGVLSLTRNWGSEHSGKRKDVDQAFRSLESLRWQDIYTENFLVQGGKWYIA